MASTIVTYVSQGSDSRCHTTSCSDSGCSLQMSEAPQPHILINLENEFSPGDKTQRHCDYLFVGGSDSDGGPWLAPIELGAKKASVLLEQLRNGAYIATGLIPIWAQVKFKPIFAHTGGIHRQEFETLRKDSSRINFRSANPYVTTVRNGDRLVDALKKPG